MRASSSRHVALFACSTIVKDFRRDCVVSKLSIRGYFWGLLFVFVCLPASFAGQAASQPLLSTYIVRTGEPLQSPHVLTYHMLEYYQTRGRWVFPDVGYYDGGNWHDGQWFVGVGAELVHSKRATWTQQLYFAQEAGSDAHNQRSLWVWPVLDLRFTPRLTAQTVVYPTVPLDKAARWGFDVDRSKLEYAFRPHLKAGAGYAASKLATSAWKNEPFLTATVMNRTGDWEFWLERMPGGAQVQLRYQLDHRDR
jgi:hypothetical protein